MDLKEITPLILTFNESPNIRRCLDSLAWAERILVIDSFSTDDTLAQVAQYPKAEVEQRAFDTFAGQWNFALASKKIRTDWVLAMDADYVLTPEAIEELKSRSFRAETTSVIVAFDYCVYGKKLSGSLYPAIPALFKREGARYQADGHTMRLQPAPGKPETLRAKILHDDRKSLTRWLGSQSRYMDQETEKIATKPPAQWTRSEHIRQTSRLTPFLVFFYTLFVKRAIFDGWAGWFYSYQRLVAELILQLKIIERRQASPTPELRQRKSA